MIQGAENVAKMYDVSRELQDEFAYRSHQLTSGKCKEWKYFSGNITYNR